jgi:FKBP-type peptidyl-prolyl cis-trans isomerase
MHTLKRHKNTRTTKFKSTQKVSAILPVPHKMTNMLQNNLELVDAPKHIVTACQFQAEKAMSDDEGNQNVTSSMVEKAFPIGSLFSFTIQTAALSPRKFKDLQMRKTGDNNNNNDNNNDNRNNNSNNNSNNNNNSDFYDADDSDDYDVSEDGDDDKTRNPLTIEIPPSTKLSINTISVDPLSMSNNDQATIMSLYISSDANEFTCICPYLSSNHDSHHYESVVRNLDLSVIGPNTLQLALVRHNRNDGTHHSHMSCGSVNIFGRVTLIDEATANAVVDAKTNHVFDELKRLEDVEDALDDEKEKLKGSSSSSGGSNGNGGSSSRRDGKDSKNDKEQMEVILTFDNPNNNTKVKKSPKSPSTNRKDERGTEKSKKKKGETPHKESSTTSGDQSSDKDRVEKKKRKLSPSSQAQGTQGDTSMDGASTSADVQQLTKKQRRKLAKKKAKELQEAIAKEQGHASSSDLTDGNTSSTAKHKPRKTSLTQQRSLPCGVLVRDIIHGNGIAVRTGRKVSINYVGRLQKTDKEFDKNNSKSAPLVFRVGTGEVIKGLDKGMEGMKVGGEREIVIPPELGYGRKGSGKKIPGDSTLCFDVKLLNVGST